MCLKNRNVKPTQQNKNANINICVRPGNRFRVLSATRARKCIYLSQANNVLYCLNVTLPNIYKQDLRVTLFLLYFNTHGYLYLAVAHI